MHSIQLIKRSFAFALFIIFFSASAWAQETAANDVVIQTMKSELAREQSSLSKQPTTPYYISYNIGDEQNVNIISSYGAIVKSDSTRKRTLLVDLRVGDYSLDNTHQIRASNDMFARSVHSGGPPTKATIPRPSAFNKCGPIRP
jgi:hypothetical protein